MLVIVLAASLSACKFLCPELAQTELVEFVFPTWPPECWKGSSETSVPYPDLSRWFVQIINAEGISSFYTQESSVPVELKKNVACAVLVTPITLNSQQQETAFFHPCGSMYPFEYNEGRQQLTWAAGFSASIFKRLYESKKETGITAEHMEQFLQGFNWKKFQTAIEEKAVKSSSYNPWLVDSYALLDSLSYGSFKQNLLDTKNLAPLTFSSLGIAYEDSLLSPYIPENAAMRETGKISVKKGEPTLLNYDTDYVVIILYTSAKNVSLEYVFMPIFLEEI